MARRSPSPERRRHAGAFSRWLAAMRRALTSGHATDVPCEGCSACCRASQFVPIGRNETETLARIPARLLFPAPRQPRGPLLLGHDEAGRCPLLVGGRCGIYAQRPRTCRVYDCRVFAAAGAAARPSAPGIARAARRWRFAFPSPADRRRHAAVRAAAVFLRKHARELPAGSARNASERAVLAVRIYGLFLRRAAGAGRRALAPPPLERLRAAIASATALAARPTGRPPALPAPCEGPPRPGPRSRRTRRDR